MSFLQAKSRRKVYVIAVVIAVLVAAIAYLSSIPPDTFSRAQVAEGLNVSSEAKATVTEHYQDHGQFPQDNAAAGLPHATDIQGKYVSSIQVDAGEIVVTYGNDANSDIHGRTLILRPEISGRIVTWVCSSVDISPRNLPQVCRGAQNSAASTSSESNSNTDPCDEEGGRAKMVFCGIGEATQSPWGRLILAFWVIVLVYWMVGRIRS